MKAFIAIMLASLMLIGCGAKPSAAPAPAVPQPADSASVSEAPETKKGISYEEICAVTTENAKRLYRIDQ